MYVTYFLSSVVFCFLTDLKLEVQLHSFVYSTIFFCLCRHCTVAWASWWHMRATTCRMSSSWISESVSKICLENLSHMSLLKAVLRFLLRRIIEWYVLFFTFIPPSFTFIWKAVQFKVKYLRQGMPWRPESRFLRNCSHLQVGFKNR